MNNEYIIVNKTALLKMRKELKKEYANWDGRIYNSDYQKGQVDLIDAIISFQSTPLIPEIDKAYENGFGYYSELLWDIEKGYGDKRTVKGLNKQDYISNLKLDI